MIFRAAKDQRGDPNFQDSGGRTPLHAASSNGHGETLNWLLSQAAPKLIVEKLYSFHLLISTII